MIRRVLSPLTYSNFFGILKPNTARICCIPASSTTIDIRHHLDFTNAQIRMKKISPKKIRGNINPGNAIYQYLPVFM